MIFPVAKRFRHRLMWFDVLLALLSLAVIGWMILSGDAFTDRNTSPETWDMVFGVALILLVIEATRRTSGWIMPIVIGFFIVYAFVGPWLPHPWTHRGYDIARLVGHMYMTLEGIFGTAVDVSATLIILFTIYGAFLQYSGAGKFFLDFSFAAHGRQVDQRRARGGDGLVPAGRALGLGRGDDGDHRLGGLPDAQEERLRAGRGRGAPGRGRPGRDPLAAGPGRGRLPDRGVPQDLLPRSDQDGDDPDHPLLLLASTSWWSSTRASTA